MINIIDIFYGWLTFKIGRNKFTVSYLDDFKYCMDYLLGIGEENKYEYHWQIESRSITLDGEGTELKLSITKHMFEDEFIINWWLNDNKPITMVFNYDLFIKQYKFEMNQIGIEKYKKEFLMESED